MTLVGKIMVIERLAHGRQKQSRGHGTHRQGDDPEHRRTASVRPALCE
jgi:hypothetical protein